MTLQEAIQARHSVRKYLDKPIEAEKINQMQALIEKSNREAGLHMQLVTNEPNAFGGSIAKYGKFSGVSNYNADRLLDLVQYNEVVPAVNQIETNLTAQQWDNREWMDKLGVQHMGYAPFGQG